MNTLAAILLSGCFASTMFASEIQLPENCGLVNLPDGFEYIPKQGVDSITGIFKKAQAEVRFDFGPMAGVHVETALQEAEEKALTIVRNSTLEIGECSVKILTYSCRDKKGAIVSYPKHLGNFYCQYRDDGELTDFLVLALSFRPIRKPAEQSVPSEGQKPSSRIPSEVPTAPAHAH